MIITLFFYAVHFVLSITILFIYLLRWDTQEDHDLIRLLSFVWLWIYVTYSMSHWHQRGATSEHFSVAENNQFNVSASRYQDAPCGVTEANTRVGLFFHQYNWFWFQWIQLLFFLLHVVYVPLILSPLSDLPGAQNRSKSITTQLKLGIIIWLLMQPVGTVCQWRGRPFLKHSGPHQPILFSGTRSEITLNPPPPQLRAMLHPIHHFFPSSVQRKAQKTTENENKCWVNPFWFYSRMELLMQLCINLTHLHTKHTLRFPTQEQKHTHTRTVASFEHTILCNWLENWKHFYFKS